MNKIYNEQFKSVGYHILGTAVWIRGSKLLIFFESFNVAARFITRCCIKFGLNIDYFIIFELVKQIAFLFFIYKFYVFVV